MVIELGHAVAVADDILNGFFQTHKSKFAVMPIQTVADVFQEVRLTSTEVTVDPNTNVATLVLLDVGEYVEEIDDNFFGKHILNDFSHYGVFTQVGGRDGRIYLAVKPFFV